MRSTFTGRPQSMRHWGADCAGSGRTCDGKLWLPTSPARYCWERPKYGMGTDMQMNSAMAELAPIPVVDVRDGGPVRYAREAVDRAHALRDACLGSLPRLTHPATPLLDAVARRWLMRSRSPYVGQIADIAAELKMPGVWLLNGSYQWGCTSLAREEDGVPWLARSLDWPFSGLGRYAAVARM